MHRSRSQAGHTLPEIIVIAATVGALVSMAIPGTHNYLEEQASIDMARGIARVFHIARTEALRTGRNHVVFFSVGGAGDGGGTALLDGNSEPAAALLLDDGPTGAPGQNCRIDAGENTRTITADSDLSWGQTFAGATRAPGDLSGAPIGSGSTFVTPTGVPTTWVLFRPDGTPVAADSLCNPGTVGSGNGAIYFTNGDRDHAIVMSALGDVRIHRWDRAAGAWKS